MRTRPRVADGLPTVGWREWVALPELGVPAIKVKVDTGARSSSLHAFDLEHFQRRGEEWVRFAIHPEQRRALPIVFAEALLADERRVRNSGGGQELRPVILTEAVLGDIRWPIEITLTSRDEMGFRMLLGRSAIQRRFLVDPGRSYAQGRRRRRRPR